MCRSRRELSNAYFLAKFGFDTEENEPCKVCPLSLYKSPRFLGIEGEQFKFDHAPTPVSFVAASISADVSPVADFIAETFA